MTNPLGLYLHIPFCAVKCPYCDFYSKPYRSADAGQYVDSLVRALSGWRGKGLTADTLYFGGGTPSLLSPAQVEKLVAAAREAFAFSGEATMEMNPNTVNIERLRAYHAAGINRVSFGVQSLQPEELAALGRRHTAEQAKSALYQAAEAGFTDISADLMLGIPYQTEASLSQTLRQLAALPVNHLSAYLLNVEGGTPYEKSPLLAECPDEDALAELYLSACTQLEQMGLAQYEISNFARPGWESRHNLKYWRCEEYLGFGPAAHSYFAKQRFYYPPSLEDWFAQKQPELSDEQAGGLAEQMMLGLRLAEGISRPPSESVPPMFWEKAARLAQAGLLTLTAERLALTRQGFLLSNEVLAELLPDF